MAVKRPPEPRQLVGNGGQESSHLALRVHTGVGASRQGYSDGFARQLPQCFLQFPLHCASVLLVLRAGVSRPFVLYHQGDSAQRRPLVPLLSGHGRTETSPSSPPTSSSWAMRAAPPRRGPSLTRRGSR